MSFLQPGHALFKVLNGSSLFVSDIFIEVFFVWDFPNIGLEFPDSAREHFSLCEAVSGFPSKCVFETNAALQDLHSEFLFNPISYIGLLV
jgi:hypothetical protein